MLDAHAAHWEHFPHGTAVGVRGVAPDGLWTAECVVDV
jgi:hypothetical protein